MNRLDEIVNAVLYEGFILYPYRASATKNKRGRFTFGRVYPQLYSEAQNGRERYTMQTQCLLQVCGDSPWVEIAVRFLQPMWREIAAQKGDKSLKDFAATNPEAPSSKQAEPPWTIVPELRVRGTVYQSWQEAVERNLPLPQMNLKPDSQVRLPFQFAESRTTEPILDEQGVTAGFVLRRQESVQGLIEVSAEAVKPQLFKLTVRISNLTPVESVALGDPDAVLMRIFASTHTILQAHEARFVSLMDPPGDLKDMAASSKNIGTWPVLVGDETKAERSTMLSSPIILYDYPKVAPESRENLFDSTEIDELLTLRILTMTDEEKQEMRDVDAQARRLLERTEAMPQESLVNLHGTLRDFRSFDEQVFGTNTRLDGIASNGSYLKTGDRVRIKPTARADIMDMALAGKTAIVEAVEQDAEQRIHLALVLEEDPGKDLGFLRQTGHRFFYGLDEVEPLNAQPKPAELEARS